jgi:hypothetical protein
MEQQSSLLVNQLGWLHGKREYENNKTGVNTEEKDIF